VPELTSAWSEGWLWLGGSLLLAVLWTNLAWLLRRPRSGPVGEFVTRLVAWRFSPSLLQSFRLLYYLGLPFAALSWGRDAVVSRLLGLQVIKLPVSAAKATGAYVAANWLDWATDGGWAAAVGIGTWGLLVLGWWFYRRAVVATDDRDATSGAGTGWVFLRESAYHEVHWAFYRNAPILTVGAYWGIWIGLGLVAVEAALNPAWRRDLAHPQRTPGLLVRAALAVVSSVLFWLTENLWLALALHWGVSWGLVVLARALPLVPDRTPDQASA